MHHFVGYGMCIISFAWCCCNVRVLELACVCLCVWQDLVKSHLLYAVREEVQEMRAQIDELVERNRQLDRENAVLRSCASPETLEFLRQQLPSPSPPDTPSRPLQRQSSYPVQQQLQQLVCNAYPVLTPWSATFSGIRFDWRGGNRTQLDAVLSHSLDQRSENIFA